ncbi:type II toxin-antitoxin system Phd/YefM family antitoxin [Candidatus Peregrinibacteria bacterium]|nr:type II toxin-antitoxin system Phd/YefM family antitoxin [Candidatus Peregrinibacteria bacterium]MBT4055849.1 type II toxin-antitoxin system Phd/YefM family antitoxin [Candidatus Peregrinibacteria bacterium]
MQIDTKNTVSATYVRNHFKEVTERVRKGAPQIIICKSKPTLVMISVEDLDKL